ncbi:MAG: Na+/H+ antiporter NhaA, partial [Pseudomonadota bacterium]
ATLAGVLAALTVPIVPAAGEEKSPLHITEKALHKWAAFLILPVFAFANAAVSFDGMSAGDVFSPLTLGIIGGLFIGKPLGVLAASLIAVRFKFASLPEGVSWRSLAGAGCLTGVGFTMSLFIGGLAFSSIDDINAIRIGVIAGSFLAGVCGALLIANPNGVFDQFGQRRADDDRERAVADVEVADIDKASVAEEAGQTGSA